MLIFLIQQIGIPAISQTNIPAVDSLLNLIIQSSENERLKLYPHLHKALYEVGNKDVHLKYNQDFIEAAIAAKNKKSEAIAYTIKLEALFNYAMPDSLILAESHKAVDFMRNIPGVEVHYFFVAAVICDIHMREGNYEKALEVAEQFYSEAKKKNNTSGLVTSLQTIGKAYEELGILDKAEISFRESITTANEKVDKGLKGESYSFLIDMLNGQKRYKEALNVNKEFEAYLKRIDAYNGELKNLCFFSDLGYATSYTKLGQYDKAWKYLSKAEQYPVASSGIGNYQVENERFNLLFKEGKYSEAEQSLDKLDEILDNDASYYKASLNQQKARGDLYYHWGKFKKSADAYNNYIVRNDSLQREEITTKLNTLRTQYEVDKLEVKQEEQKRTLRNTIFWFSLVFVLLCGIIIISIVNTRKVRAKNRSLLNHIQEQDELQLKYEQMLSKQAKSNTFPPKESIEDESCTDLYFRLKELMKDPAIFTDPSINRKMLAEKLGTNEKYIFDTIKEYYGTNISDYINSLRLNYARNLLALPSDNRTIDTIAHEAGFNSRSTFYRLFKEYYGMTPLEFRRLVANS